VKVMWLLKRILVYVYLTFRDMRSGTWNTSSASMLAPLSIHHVRLPSMFIIFLSLNWVFMTHLNVINATLLPDLFLFLLSV